MTQITPQTKAALDAATKTELVHLLRAMMTVRLMDLPEDEVRATVRTLLETDTCKCEEVLEGLGVITPLAIVSEDAIVVNGELGSPCKAGRS